ncbi:dTDP-4-dehydrorhamnose 3,5-epimerase [Advenella mimigardefordensis]|uniref:dTDP-4-dehydrorhamnose 3,5-epimerase n=1 Tax=Advenella mimigardefordensis (strain DSM 17166 / LMG 22922 / DPN7) TaxID=1247726 RepID=W0PIV5_ADVMD|nr:dTDP-4-dehydrorhamnose 3,5-epimerase [Advenella mimigardefordensis]AHG65932.1 dTDP-4-dehydrorhamnose 3,5-epimerase [Advenella mimigardefordensis DPN7]
MKTERLVIPDVLLLTPKVHRDERGYFMEAYRQQVLDEALGRTLRFVQDNESQSSYGVLRGLHYQLPPYAQNKLVRVVAGRVLDVIVDLRKSSATFGQSLHIELDAMSKQSLFIPAGFAHGFVVLSEQAIFTYKTDAVYAPDYERGLAFDDPQLNINWQVPREQMILSPRDRRFPVFAGLRDLYP